MTNTTECIATLRVGGRWGSVYGCTLPAAHDGDHFNPGEPDADTIVWEA